MIAPQIHKISIHVGMLDEEGWSGCDNGSIAKQKSNSKLTSIENELKRFTSAFNNSHLTLC